MPLMDLFPPLTPYSSGFLAVDATHNLYWEQSGNPDGVPILLLHGGPGAGATPTHRRFFDPEYYRIIIFDQRGAGRSHPLGSIENNTLDALIQDIETLREHLRIDRWHLFGGSWGSTLALGALLFGRDPETGDITFSVNPLRGGIVFGCVVAFLGFWIVMLRSRQSRLNKETSGKDS